MYEYIFSGYCDVPSGGLDRRAPSGDFLDGLCRSIMSDQSPFFMFRVISNGDTSFVSDCPFDGSHSFSYSTRAGRDTCREPRSMLDRCTDRDRMVFRFRACPDVRGSESGGKSVVHMGQKRLLRRWLKPHLALYFPSQKRLLWVSLQSFAWSKEAHLLLKWRGSVWMEAEPPERNS